MSAEKYLLGLDLGGTSVKGVAVTPGGKTLHTYKRAFELQKPMAFAASATEVVAMALEDCGPPERIGLSAPGIANREATAIAHMPGRFHGLEGFNWGQHLRRKEGVRVLNDAQAALLGEVWLGAARGSWDAILITLGTGVGGAVMVDGQLLRGHTGKAGHLGHISLDPGGAPDICGMPGSLEDAIGNHNILARTGGRFPTTLELIKAYQQGDSAAAEMWRGSLRALAAAIASLGNVLDPDVVIIGGGIAGAGPLLFKPLNEFLATMEWRPAGKAMRVVPAGLSELAGAYGAAWNTYR
ncbi:MAG TPA: ROK family protein [Candidatus Limnocylindria bacterium]|nr:ROK family protein [Candidatus Limnocylindria bacterium]